MPSALVHLFRYVDNVAIVDVMSLTIRERGIQWIEAEGSALGIMPLIYGRHLFPKQLSMVVSPLSDILLSFWPPVPLLFFLSQPIRIINQILRETRPLVFSSDFHAAFMAILLATTCGLIFCPT
jgi:hypothetical protein